MRFNPFPPVSGKYGAPMGRTSANPANFKGLRPSDLCVSRPPDRDAPGGVGYGEGETFTFDASINNFRKGE